MPDSDFWDKVATKRDERKPPKGPYTQADLVLALAEMRAVLKLAAERIKAQSIGRKDAVMASPRFGPCARCQLPPTQRFTARPRARAHWLDALEFFRYQEYFCVCLRLAAVLMQMLLK